MGRASIADVEKRIVCMYVCNLEELIDGSFSGFL